MFCHELKIKFFSTLPYRPMVNAKDSFVSALSGFLLFKILNDLSWKNLKSKISNNFRCESTPIKSNNGLE